MKTYSVRSLTDVNQLSNGKSYWDLPGVLMALLINVNCFVKCL